MQYIQIYGLITHKYWDLKNKTVETKRSAATNNIYSLIKNATKLRVNKKSKVGIIYPESKSSCIIASLTKKITNDINTFTYNNTNTKNSTYLKSLKKHLKIDNYNIISDNRVLNSLLSVSLLSSDMPGMAHTDSTILEFLLAIKNNGLETCLSSLYTNDIFKNISTPLLLSTVTRSSLINKDIIKKDTLEKYTHRLYNEITNNITNLDNTKEKQDKYVNIKWHLTNLIERFNQISSNIGLDIFFPYLDYKIIEYVYNLEDLDNTKHIDKLFKKLFPDINHKEYIPPQSYNEDYLNILEHELKKTLKDSSSKLLKIIDKNFVLDIIETKGKNLKENKNDKLMTYSEILAYLIQIEYWLNIYEIKIEF